MQNFRQAAEPRASVTGEPAAVDMRLSPVMNGEDSRDEMPSKLAMAAIRDLAAGHPDHIWEQRLRRLAPWRAKASSSASHTGSAVARATTRAQTTNRE